jgi:hypothetical protein
LGYDQNRADLKDWVDEMYKEKDQSTFWNSSSLAMKARNEILPKSCGNAHEHQINI